MRLALVSLLTRIFLLFAIKDRDVGVHRQVRAKINYLAVARENSNSERFGFTPIDSIERSVVFGRGLLVYREDPVELQWPWR